MYCYGAENVFEQKVTILLPVYNGEKYLRKSIESALIQTFENFELLDYKRWLYR